MHQHYYYNDFSSPCSIAARSILVRFIPRHRQRLLCTHCAPWVLQIILTVHHQAREGHFPRCDISEWSVSSQPALAPALRRVEFGVGHAFEAQDPYRLVDSAPASGTAGPYRDLGRLASGTPFSRKSSRKALIIPSTSRICFL
jgi:hypothetical protein